MRSIMVTRGKLNVFYALLIITSLISAACVESARLGDVETGMDRHQRSWWSNLWSGVKKAATFIANSDA
ncbi:Hypothetical predicted protein [Cloeon dipterum]|uniref:Uncharacterized protein n=1 Tax=Cloeon dipterum TaxID=197152 RepID=A0A8S1D7K5_9INSE|nr:Hypothetical predicted protein [Cloeon dipterum]